MKYLVVTELESGFESLESARIEASKIALSTLKKVFILVAKERVQIKAEIVSLDDEIAPSVVEKAVEPLKVRSSSKRSERNAQASVAKETPLVEVEENNKDISIPSHWYEEERKEKVEEIENNEEEEEETEIDPEQEFLNELSDVKSKAHLVKILSNTPQEIKDKYKNESKKMLEDLEEKLQQKVLEQNKKNADTSLVSAKEDAKLFKEFSDEIQQAESSEEFKLIVNQEKYKHVGDSKYASNYTSQKEKRLYEIQEVDILRDLKYAESLDELDAILASYPPVIGLIPSVLKEIRNVEFQIGGEKRKDILPDAQPKPEKNNVDLQIIDSQEVEVAKDIVGKGFDGCLYIEDLEALKENFKAKYPKFINHQWFGDLFYSRARELKGKNKKFAETLK